MRFVTVTAFPEPTFLFETVPVPVCDKISEPTKLLYVNVVATLEPLRIFDPSYYLLATRVIGLGVTLIK